MKQKNSASQNKELSLLNLFVMFKFVNGINRIKAEYNEITIGKDYNHMDMLLNASVLLFTCLGRGMYNFCTVCELRFFIKGQRMYK